MKPKPFIALYHLTVPLSWLLGSSAGRSDGGRKPVRGRGGAAVLVSTLMTSVTCGPR